MGKSQSRRSKGPASRQKHLERFQRRLLWLLLALLAVIALAIALGDQRSQAQRWLDDWLGRPQAAGAVSGRRIGIVAGHRGFDSGAVCDDGVSEAAVVQAIAERVGDRLRGLGAEVDLLDEYDPQLNGYQADVFVSIHADSCIERSGFKAARSETSAMPEVEDRLLGCMMVSYGEATGLSFDSNSITPDMTGYHGLKRVATDTPALIIEVGFLGGDAGVIVRQPDLPARGIVNGITCFLGGEPGR
jgi:N-acetylmuramoyl-L-alanine amidase